MDIKKLIEDAYPTSEGVKSVTYGDYIKVIRNGSISYFIKEGDDIIHLNGFENKRYTKDSIHNGKFTSIFREIQLNKIGI